MKGWNPLFKTWIQSLRDNLSGVNSVLHPMSLAIWPVLPQKWEAYCVDTVKVLSRMQI